MRAWPSLLPPGLSALSRLSLVVVLSTVIALAAVPVALAQGSALDYMSDSDTRRASSPQEQAAQHLARGRRHFAKAEKLASEATAAGGDSRLAGKAHDAYRRALAELERATAKDPSLAEAQLYTGLAYLALGEPAKATSACHQAWALGARPSEAALCEARAQLARGQVRAAQGTYLTLEGPEPTGARLVLAELRAWGEAHPQDAEAEGLDEWLAARASGNAADGKRR